jgi:hypothetical protein
MTSRSLAALAVVLTGAACSTGESTGPNPLETCQVTLSTPVTLAPASYIILNPPADSGCVTFPADTTIDSVEYLLIPQSAGGTPGDSAPFRLQGATPISASASPLFAIRRQPGRRGRIPTAFDRFLLTLARRPGALAAPRVSPPGAASLVAAAGPPQMGSLRSFIVCTTLDCGSFATVTGRVRAIGAHVAVYVDTLAPAGGLDSAAIDTLTRAFDTHAYTVDTVAFGGVSDIDSNRVVLTLMTPVVNRLVTAAQCQSGGFVAGFFFPPDLDPSTAATYNDGEIFYTVVADPNGTLSCSHTVSDVENFLPATFLHELQHVISYNQHVLVRHGAPEDLWLDEALSSLAEELGGISYLPDVNTYSRYVLDDVYDAYQYLASPGDHFLLQTSDTVLADFGAGWLYLRYLVDQFGDSLTNKLVETALTGTDNVAAQTQLPFATTVARWALANWVSDLPGFTPPAELRYTSWSFRQTFASLFSQDPADFPTPFPLVPAVSDGMLVNLSGYLRVGTGSYARALQSPGDSSFSLRFSGSNGPPSAAVAPRLTVIRLR